LSQWEKWVIKEIAYIGGGSRLLFGEGVSEIEMDGLLLYNTVASDRFAWN